MWSRATCLPDSQETQCLCSLPSLLQVREVPSPQPVPAWPSLSRSPGPHHLFPGVSVKFLYLPCEPPALQEQTMWYYFP